MSKQTNSNTQQKKAQGPSKQKQSNRNQKVKKTQSTIGGFPVQDRKPAMNTSRPQHSKAPKITPTTDGCIVAHRELIETKTSDAVANVLKMSRYRINPASEETFPWLSKIAPSWETYVFEFLEFHFIPRVSAISDGSVYLSPDYDAADHAVQDEQELSANVDCQEDGIWHEIRCKLKRERMNAAYKQHFTCNDARFKLTKQDQKTLDPAFFTFASETPDANKKIGKLWVKYVVRFKTPQQPTLPLDQGGADFVKDTGLAAGVTNVFTTNAVTNYANTLDEVLDVIPQANFPNKNLFTFNRDWQGIVSKEVNGSTISNLGDLLINNVVQTVMAQTPITNSTGSRSAAQWKVNATKGDELGSGPITAGAVSAVIHHLGGMAF